LSVFELKELLLPDELLELTELDELLELSELEELLLLDKLLELTELEELKPTELDELDPAFSLCSPPISRVFQLVPFLFERLCLKCSIPFIQTEDCPPTPRHNLATS